MGVKGFQKGHLVSDETRAKISKANNGNFFAICDYCGKEYIERNELIKNLNYFAPEHYSDLINELITKQPAADVAPIRHGRWVNESFYTHCSVCGNTAMYDKYGQEAESDYCPNCGCRMDGGDDE